MGKYSESSLVKIAGMITVIVIAVIGGISYLVPKVLKSIC